MHAMRLACPSLPVGAYAYSQGLEYAVEAGWVTDRQSAADWISGLLKSTLGGFDLPLLSRLYRAWSEQNLEQTLAYERWVLAGRESEELRTEELNLGAALLKLLIDLGVANEGHLDRARECGYLSAFALSAVCYGLSEQVMLTSYCFAWLEHQTSAVTRLIPLGQTDGQLVLSTCLALAPAVLAASLELPDEAIGALAPGQAIASALHETQYTRLFRS
jgi:urease accessory protein